MQDERGRIVFEIAKPGGAIERPYRIRWLELPLGKFTLFVETAGGGKAETTFEMTSLEENQSPVVLRAK